MHTNLYIFFLLFFSSEAYCQAIPDVNKAVILNYIIDENKNVFITRYDGDDIDDFAPNTLTIIGKTSLPPDTILVNRATFFYNSNRKSIPFLVYPGENIKIITKGNFLQFILLNNRMRNNELNFLSNLYSDLGDILISQTDYGRKLLLNKDQSVSKILDSIDALVQVRNQYLISFNSNFSMSKGYIEFMKLFINYSSLYDKSMFLYNRDESRKDVLNFIFTKKQTFLQDTLIYHKFYRKTLVRFSQLAFKYLSKSETDYSQINFIDSFFSGKNRDFLLYHLISSYPKISSDSQLVSYIGSLITDEKINQTINDKFGTKITDYDSKITTAYGAEYVFKKSIAKNDGSISYVDFWASWCAPCRAEMPASKKLQEKFKGAPIQFVYISTDEKPNAWLKANKIEGLEQYPHSFLLANPKDASIVKELRIVTIPRYVIFDRTGKVLVANAPRPSDPKLIPLLHQLMKNAK